MAPAFRSHKPSIQLWNCASLPPRRTLINASFLFFSSLLKPQTRNHHCPASLFENLSSKLQHRFLHLRPARPTCSYSSCHYSECSPLHIMTSGERTQNLIIEYFRPHVTAWEDKANLTLTGMFGCSRYLIHVAQWVAHRINEGILPLA